MKILLTRFLVSTLVDTVKRILGGGALNLPIGPLKDNGVKFALTLATNWLDRHLSAGKGPLDESDLRAITKIISQKKGELVLLFANKGFAGLLSQLKIEAAATDNTLDDLKVEAVAKAIEVAIITLDNWMQANVDGILAGLLTKRQCELIIVALRGGVEDLFEALRNDAAATENGMDDMIVEAIEKSVRLVLVQLQNWVETEIETVEVAA